MTWGKSFNLFVVSLSKREMNCFQSVFWRCCGSPAGMGKSSELLGFGKSSNVFIHFRCWNCVRCEQLRVWWSKITGMHDLSILLQLWYSGILQRFPNPVTYRIYFNENVHYISLTCRGQRKSERLKQCSWVLSAHCKWGVRMVTFLGLSEPRYSSC